MIKKLPLLILITALMAGISCDKNDNEVKPDFEHLQQLLSYSSTLKVGIASCNINPDTFEGVSLEGYGYRTSSELNDTLTARTIVISKDSSYVALIALDLIGTTQKQTEKLKEKIYELTGIPANKIYVHGTHTHSGPSMLDGRVDNAYLNKLCSKTAVCVVNAVENLKAVTTTYKTGVSSVATVNRRNPEREVSNTFHVIDFTDSNDNIVASILNFSCHPVVLGPNNLKITGDFVHYLREAYDAQTGGLSLFFNGHFGNINPARSDSGNAYDRSKGTFTQAKTFGSDLANDMINNYSSATNLNISISHKTIRTNSGFNYTYASIINLGELQIAMIPGEPLDSFAKEVENLLPGPYKMSIGNMYEHIGYIVPENEWEQCSNSFKPECYEENVGGGAIVAPLLLEKYRELCVYMFNK